MGELRELRRTVGLLQRELADLLCVPVNTLRMWDSGVRPVPPQVLHRAKEIVANRVSEAELLPLDRLAHELGVHLRTLQAAARSGRLAVQFSSESVFGRPLRFETRAAGEKFYSDALSEIRRSRGVSVPAPGGARRLPRAADTPSSSVAVDSRRVGATHWCCRKSGRLSVGVEKEDPVTRLLGPDSTLGHRRESPHHERSNP
jgi:transcriptional regulator with XRE-family HTH domain